MVASVESDGRELERTASVGLEALEDWEGRELDLEALAVLEGLEMESEGLGASEDRESELTELEGRESELVESAESEAWVIFPRMADWLATRAQVLSPAITAPQSGRIAT
jgi:hypothetical protein